MRLWTIQRGRLIERARLLGIAAPAWADVQARWHEAFRWILSRAPAVPDVPPLDAAPVWAWHSCGAWQRPPLAEDIDMLLGEMDASSRSSLVVAELAVPDELALLTRYGRWNEILEEIDRSGRFSPSALDPLFEVQSLRGRSWRGSGNVDDIQACLRVLRAEWIGDTTSLGDWCIDHR